MIEPGELQISRIARKVQNTKRLLGIESRIQDQLGLTAFDPKIRLVAIDKLRSERRTEERDKRRRWNQKFEFLNESAYEEDMMMYMKRFFPSKEAFNNPQQFQRFHIIRFDLGMLNFFNSLPGGHQTGDRYKIQAGDIIAGKTNSMTSWLTENKIKYNAYLVGGDEFTIVLEADKQIVQRLAMRIRNEVSKIDIPEDNLKVAQVNYGIADLGEALEQHNLINRNSIIAVMQMTNQTLHA